MFKFGHYFHNPIISFIAHIFVGKFNQKKIF